MEETPLDQFNTPAPPDQGSFGKILLWNFGLMFGFMLLSSTAGADSLIYDLCFMILQMVVNFLGGLFFILAKRRQAGLALLLSAFLVVLVGFGMCAGKAAIMGG